MVTIGRFSFVQRSIAMFLAQTFTDSELVILHTDAEQPLTLQESNPRVRIINNSLDYLTGLPYTNTGAIRRDCLTHATGEYYVCWDDDDVFLPWALQQAYDGVTAGNGIVWKPKQSFWRDQSGTIDIAQNVMEASCIVNVAELRKIGFNLSSGPEGLSWYLKLRDSRLLNENERNFCPSYCFDWQHDPKATHRQSGGINDPDNFANHVRASQDRPNGRLLDPNSVDIAQTYEPFYAWLRDNASKVNQEYAQRYAGPFLAR